MKLKQILFTSIAALSLSGSLYGMSADKILQLFAQAVIDRNEFGIIHFKDKVDINAVNPYLSESAQLTALDYAMEKMDSYLVKTLLLYAKSNVNAPGKNYLSDAIKKVSINHNLIKEAKKIIHLLCTAGITIDIDDEHFNNMLSINDEEIHTILQNHINSRLARALSQKNTPADEIKQIIIRYNIDINQELLYYTEICESSWISRECLHEMSFIPLHNAIQYKQHDVVLFLINEHNADVTLKDDDGKTALHYGPDFEMAQLLIEKGCNPNVADNYKIKPLDMINTMLAPNRLNEHNPETIANLRKLKTLYGGINYTLWIGGGAVVVVAAIAAKKLYNWWYKEADVTQEETCEADAEHTDQQHKDADKNKMATQV